MKRNLAVNRLLAVPILAASALALSSQMTPAGAADASCPATPSFTVTHITVTTMMNGPEFDGTGQVTVVSNAPGYDLTTTGQTGFQYDENGSQDTTHLGTVYDSGPGVPRPGDTRTYTLEIHPMQSNACYDTDTGEGDGSQVADKTLTVTYYAVGEGGEGTVDGAVLPGSTPETPVPGAPSPTISGASRVGQTDTCTATAPAHDAAGGYKWYAAGTQVATGSSYRIQAADYGKPLTCGAVVYNNARKPGPLGKSGPANIGLGDALDPVNGPPALAGETRSGGHLRVTHGFWTPKASSYAYQWYVGTKKLKGATSHKIVVPKSAIGKHLYVRVTASAHGYKNGTIKIKSMKIPF